jgi:hypothetical protein
LCASFLVARTLLNNALLFATPSLLLLYMQRARWVGKNRGRRAAASVQAGLWFSHSVRGE